MLSQNSVIAIQCCRNIALSQYCTFTVKIHHFQWKNLYSRKPSENYEDPVLIAAIDYAKENMGDFNLKTATNYKVPESQRQGGTFKRNQLLELRKTVRQGKVTIKNDETNFIYVPSFRSLIEIFLEILMKVGCMWLFGHRIKYQNNILIYNILKASLVCSMNQFLN